MPGFDGGGPWGDGPMSGRGMGYCTGYNEGPRPQGLGYGRGFRGGRGGFGGGRDACWGDGRGWGRGYGWGAASYYSAPPPFENDVPLTASQEAKMLKANLKQYQRAMEDIQARLSDIESETKDE